MSRRMCVCGLFRVFKERARVGVVLKQANLITMVAFEARVGCRPSSREASEAAALSCLLKPPTWSIRITLTPIQPISTASSVMHHTAHSRRRADRLLLRLAVSRAAGPRPSCLSQQRLSCPPARCNGCIKRSTLPVVPTHVQLAPQGHGAAEVCGRALVGLREWDPAARVAHTYTQQVSTKQGT